MKFGTDGVRGVANSDLTASFGNAAPTLTGSLSNSALKVQVTAAIDTATAGFAGTAQARNTATNALLSSGTSQGSFFGAGSTASLAGIAKFTNRDYDTAFGGVAK